jgi:hypothetical protein
LVTVTVFEIIQFMKRKCLFWFTALEVPIHYWAGILLLGPLGEDTGAYGVTKKPFTS